MTTLTPNERATLSPDDRAMLDDALQRIPSERNPEFTAFMLSIRAIIRHDTASVRNGVSGVFELQDKADEAARELLDAARELRTQAQALADSVSEARQEIAALRDNVTRDRADALEERRVLWEAIAHLRIGVAIIALLVLVVFVAHAVGWM